MLLHSYIGYNAVFLLQIRVAAAIKIQRLTREFLKRQKHKRQERANHAATIIQVHTPHPLIKESTLLCIPYLVTAGIGQYIIAIVKSL